MRNLLLPFVLFLIYSNISHAQSRYEIDNFVAPATTYTNIGADGENVSLYAEEAGMENGVTIPLIRYEAVDAATFQNEYMPALTDSILIGFDGAISNASFEIACGASKDVTLTGLAFNQGTPVNGYWGIGNNSFPSNVAVTSGNSDPKDVNFYIEAGETIDSLVFIIDKQANSTAHLGIHAINWISTNGNRPLANPDLSMTGACNTSLDVMFLLDNSSSIVSSEFEEIRTGTIAGLTSLYQSNPTTPIKTSFVKYGTMAEVGPMDVLLEETSLKPGGDIYDWMHNTYGATGSAEKTNWVDALQKAKDTYIAGDEFELLILFTDGMVNNNEDLADVTELANYLKGEGIHILFLGAGQMGPNIIKNVAGYLTKFPNPIEYDNATNIAEGDYRYMTNYGELELFLERILVSCIVTPVELMDFDAYAEDCEVQLEWATASEIDNSHFNVERSADGYNFRTIGKVEGNGTTSDIMNYAFRDENPSATNYYRLKQMDYDGVFEYSDVIEAKASNCTTYAVYPTMPTSELTIKSNEAVETQLSIMITDLAGKKVMLKDMNSRNDTQFTLDVSTLNRGIYFVSIMEEGVITSTFKILK